MSISLLVSGLLALLLLMQSKQLAPRHLEARIIATALLVLLIANAGLLLSFRWEPFSRNITECVSFFTIVDRLSIFFAFIATWLAARYWRIGWQVMQLLGGMGLGIILLTILLHAWDTASWRWTIAYTFKGYHRPHGILLTPLEAGCVGLCSWAWGTYWSLQSDWRRWFGIGLTGLSSAVVYLTLSRSAWLGLGVATLIGLLLIRHNPALWLPLIMTITIFVICSFGLPQGWNRSLYAAEGDPSVQTRLDQWSHLPAILLSYPFGVPEEPTSLTLSQKAPPVGNMLNFYFDIGIEFGIVSMLLLIGVAFGVIIFSVRFGLLGQPEVGWGLGAIATIVCLLFMSLGGIGGAFVGGLWGLISALEVEPNAPKSVHID